MYTHLEQRDSTRPPVSLGTLDKMKREHEKIACITCYDASFAVLVRQRRRRPGAGGRFARHGAAGPRHHGARDHGRHRLSLQSRGARTASAVPGRRPAVRELPDGRHRARELRAPHAGRRRGDGEARKRPRPARDRRVPRAPRHRGVRAPRPEAAVGAQDRRLPRAGARRSGRETHARERQGARIRGRRHRAARMHSVGARQEDHRGARSAGHRHRRGPGHRRADPRALRRARHHLRPQAALREELHGRRHVQSRRAQALRRRR